MPKAKSKSPVQLAARDVIDASAVLRETVASLAQARSASGELASEDWEAIAEAHQALGGIPRPA